MKNKTVLLSDYELDNVAGGKGGGALGLPSLYKQSSCPGPINGRKQSCEGKCCDYIQCRSKGLEPRTFMACRHILSFIGAESF